MCSDCNNPTISEVIDALHVCIDTMFVRKREVPLVGNQTCGAELYSIRFSGYELGVIYEQLDILHDMCKTKGAVS